MEQKVKKDFVDEKWFAVRTRDGWERKVCDAILSKATNLDMQDEIKDACVVYSVVAKKKVKSAERKKKTYRSEFDVDSEPIVDSYINFTEEELEKMKAEEERRYEYEDVREISIKGYVYVKIARVKKDDPSAKPDKNGSIGKIDAPSNEAWQAIRNITGVMGIYSQMNIPIPIKQADVKKLRLEDSDARKEVGVVVLNEKKAEAVQDDILTGKTAVKVLFAVGDTVMVKDGAYSGTIGQVENIDLDNNVVNLKIEFFGRQVNAEMPLNSVEKI